MKLDYIIVIPARLKSVRLPRKPLVNISGIPMVIRTYSQCLKVVDKSKIFIATDSQEIIDIADKYNFNSVLTSDKALTGTDRVAEVATIIESDYYINIQGDEPIFNPDDIKLIIDSIKDNNGKILNGYTEIKKASLFKSISVPKVCIDINENLLYMSRAAIPANKGNDFIKGWRQVCAYAFPKFALEKFSSYGRKTPLEEIEDIEILRFLELGVNVKMIKMSSQSIPVDHIEDIKLVEEYLKKNEIK
tara:strand:+ start:2856 stop:3596 length:741 start_codon:yes stop_codon:yes gene_type:complete